MSLCARPEDRLVDPLNPLPSVTAPTATASPAHDSISPQATAVGRTSSLKRFERKLFRAIGGVATAGVVCVALGFGAVQGLELVNDRTFMVWAMNALLDTVGAP